MNSVKKVEIVVEGNVDRIISIMQNFQEIKRMNVAKMTAEEEKLIQSKLKNLQNLNGFKLKTKPLKKNSNEDEIT